MACFWMMLRFFGVPKYLFIKVTLWAKYPLATANVVPYAQSIQTWEFLSMTLSMLPPSNAPS